ncbi:MAG: quinolinate synthase NadA [Candidatus Dormibacteraeota bacterium]|uniref:Quinolinate synthase n=1 Tax=Candidatus Amunia macphersoniae TaxID=3127014 RepID=A0A934KGR3_9BACT|nr:quinolinate synthase NadA [Candidatus Dormibacteraeota bacterium]
MLAVRPASDAATGAGLPERIERLRQQRRAVILAHNYQLPEVQDIADFVGDSLGLSQQAANTDAEVIVFCGVHFMAETAAILSPDRTVLLPDLAAGCSLADTITADQLRAWKADHPGALVVSYVNTSAEVKAESDYCCTSSNAAAIVNSIPRDREILFCPDMFLGAHVERVTGRTMHVWMGECHVHGGIEPAHLDAVRRQHPGAELLIHPECGCTTSALYRSSSGDLPGPTTVVTSTEGMVRRAAESPASTFIVATEVGILHRMEKVIPGKRFLPASRGAVCQYMKMITLPKVAASLETLTPRVTVAPEIAARARVAIERMLAVPV